MTTETSGGGGPSVEVGRVGNAAGALLAGGGGLALVANVLFPRADAPFDVPAVLTMMVEHHTRRQISFLAVTAAIVAIAAGVAGIHRTVASVDDGQLGRLGVASLLVGTTLFAAASALGLAATAAAVEWAAAGSPPTGVEFAVAAALNAADDHVWFLSITFLWGGLGLIGAAWIRSKRVPRWQGAIIAVAGLTTAGAVGVPLAYGIQSTILLLGFGVLATITALWAVATGVWALRNRRIAESNEVRE